MTKSSAYTTIVHSVPLPIGSASDLHWLSIVTAFVSIGTLLAVFRQIKIANTQLSVANDSLALAKEQIDLGNQELQAVKEDLDLNRQQVSELTRRPNLQIVFQNRTQQTTYFTTSFGCQHNVEFPIIIENVGFRASSSCQINLFVPVESLYNSIGQKLKTRNIHGQECVRIPQAFASIIYPDDFAPVPNLRLSLLFRSQNEHVTFFYRLYDDFGSYPGGMEFGELSLYVKPPDAANPFLTGFV